MEQLINAVAGNPTSVIAVALLLLIYYLIKNMERMVNCMDIFSETLQKVSETLLRIDMRVEQLEERLNSMEGGNKRVQL